MYVFTIPKYIYPLNKIIELIETCLQIFYENYCIPTNKLIRIDYNTEYPLYKINTTLSEINKIALLDINKIYIIQGSKDFIEFLYKVKKNNWIIIDTDLRTEITCKFFCYKKISMITLSRTYNRENLRIFIEHCAYEFYYNNCNNDETLKLQNRGSSILNPDIYPIYKFNSMLSNNDSVTLIVKPNIYEIYGTRYFIMFLNTKILNPWITYIDSNTCNKWQWNWMNNKAELISDSI